MSVTFEFPDEAIRYLDETRQILGTSASRGETLRHALAILRWTAEKVGSGCTILAVTGDGEVGKQLSNPLLDSLAESVANQLQNEAASSEVQMGYKTL